MLSRQCFLKFSYLFHFSFLYFGGVLTKTIIPIACWMASSSLATYHNGASNESTLNFYGTKCRMYGFIYLKQTIFSKCLYCNRNG